MRTFQALVFDDVLDSSTPLYIDPSFNDELGRMDQLSIFGVAIALSGTAPTLSVQIEESADQIHWQNKRSTPEINAAAVSLTTYTNVQGRDSGVAPSSCCIRLRVEVGGSSPRVHAKLWVAARSAAEPLSVGPTDPLTIVASSSAIFYLNADVGITIGTGVSAWADQSGNGRDATQGTAGSQPALQSAVLNGKNTLGFDGVDDFLTMAYIPPAPGTTPSWYFVVFQTITRVTAATIFASNNTNRHRLFWSNTSAINQSCGTSGTTMARAASQWYRGEVFFNNATTDYKRIGNSSNTGVNTGNNAGSSSFTIGANNSSATNPTHSDIACIGAWPAEPTSEEKAALDAWVTAYYGSGVEV